MSKWEVCAANWFYNFVPNTLAESDAGIIYFNITDKEFRLYCLSVLWRMSASKLPYFEGVLLPDEDSEVIRYALLSEDTLDNIYPVGFAKITNLVGEELAISVQPYCVRESKHLSFHLLANGFMHDFWMGGYDATPAFVNCSLTPEGILTVPSFTYFEYPAIARAMRHQLEEYKKNGEPQR